SQIDALAKSFVPSVPNVVTIAQKWVAARVPYLWGGNNMDGIDCSGLVQQVFGALGIQLPRTAATQYAATQRTSDPQPGDLVFFHDTDPSDPGIDHVGIVVDPFAGTMIDAPEPGIPVSVDSYVSPFYSAHFQGFGRVSS